MKTRNTTTSSRVGSLLAALSLTVISNAGASLGPTAVPGMLAMDNASSLESGSSGGFLAPQPWNAGPTPIITTPHVIAPEAVPGIPTQRTWVPSFSHSVVHISGGAGRR